MATNMHNVRYVVVELAGYVGEKDVATYSTDREAWDHIAREYSDEERDHDNPDGLYPDVRTDWTDDEGEEHSEYIS